MSGLWAYVQDKDHRETLGWLAGGFAAVVGAGWTVFTRLRDDKKPAKGATTITAPHGVAAQTISGGQFTFNATTDNAPVLAAIADLSRQLLAHGSIAPLPGAAEAIGEAVGAIVRGAQAGDARLQRALDLLKANKPAEAVPLLRAVAEEKTARIKADSKDAAAAYRNLGAIAGLGNPKAALDAYGKAVELDPSDVESLLWVGWIEIGRGPLAGADQRLRRVLVLTDHDPDARARRWATIGLGDIASRRGDLPGALERYRDVRASLQRLAASDPGNAGWQRDLSVSYERVGDVLVAQGDRAGALKSYRDGLAIAERLAASDAGNADWQRDLSVSYDRVGDVLVAQGDRAGALKSYRDGLAIRERLAASDPGNADWQRDLSVSYDRVGNVLVAQGDRAGALKSYRDSLGIRERLAASDPGNADWQRDLSVSYEKVGNVLVAQGDRAGALKSYRDGLAIRERLAASDPDNADWQVDVVISQWKLAALGDDAARRWGIVVAGLRALGSENRLTAEQAAWLPVAETNLAKATKP